MLGEEQPDTLISMNNLAGYYNRLGDSKKAAEMGEQCWDTRNRVLGEELYQGSARAKEMP